MIDYNPIKRFKIYQAGHCTHPGCVAEKGCGIEPREFPAYVALIEHERYGLILFDTGYDPEFFTQTRSFPESLYARTTPVTLPVPLVEQLQADGIDQKDIGHLVVSHFHADHIAGLKRFTEATFVADERGYRKLMAMGRWRQVMQGFLKGLLPRDFESRTAFVNDYPESVRSILRLDAWRYCNLRAAPLFKDGSAYLVNLPGHAAGHIGLLFRMNGTWVLLCGDAYWTQGNLNPDGNGRPSWLARLIMDSPRQFDLTLDAIARLRLDGGDRLRVIGSHDSSIAQGSPTLEFV